MSSQGSEGAAAAEVKEAIEAAISAGASPVEVEQMVRDLEKGSGAR
jgi:chromosome segregation and condensation protein ScpB